MKVFLSNQLLIRPNGFSSCLNYASQCSVVNLNFLASSNYQNLKWLWNMIANHIFILSHLLISILLLDFSKTLEFAFHHQIFLCLGQSFSYFNINSKVNKSSFKSSNCNNNVKIIDMILNDLS